MRKSNNKKNRKDIEKKLKKKNFMIDNKIKKDIEINKMIDKEKIEDIKKANKKIIDIEKNKENMKIYLKIKKE